MEAKSLSSFARTLRSQRRALIREVADTEADLASLGEEHEPELEDRATDEGMVRLLARLDLRSRHEIAEIDAALDRLDDGSYGTCVGCEKPIPKARLRAVPATPFCVACAALQEVAPPAARQPEVVNHGASAPLDDQLLTDREVESNIREQIRLDPRIDRHELRVVYRHGVVYLDGVLPSEAEHQMLRKLVTDVVGISEIDDRVRVNELLWQREDRALPPPLLEPPVTEEPPRNKDLVEFEDEELEFESPVAPIAEEE